MVLLAAFKALLYRYTQQEDIIISAPMAGRNRLETGRVVGFFVNILPFTYEFVGQSIHLRVFCARFEKLPWPPVPTRTAPFEKIVEELHPEKGCFSNAVCAEFCSCCKHFLGEAALAPGFRRRQCLARVSPTFGQAHIWTFSFSRPTMPLQNSKLSLSVQETSVGLAVRAEYNPALFAESTSSDCWNISKFCLRASSQILLARFQKFPCSAIAERTQLLVSGTVRVPITRATNR